MHTFGQLTFGDMFNTKSGRFVKLSDQRAICVLSAIHQVGALFDFEATDEVVVLYSEVVK